jgi:glycosyltransferase involved in cell wall biosynthesis
MHIVYVHRGMVPDMVGGTYSHIYELGRRLAARGHAVDVIASTKTPGAAGRARLEGMTVHRYSFRRLNPVYSTLQHLAKTYAIYRAIAADEPVDVLSVNDSQLGLRVAESSLGRAACQIPTFHAPIFLEFRLNTRWRLAEERNAARRLRMRASAPALERMQRRYETRILEAAQAILVLSQYTRGLIETHFPSVDLSKVRIIPGGVDTDRFRPAEDRAAVRSALCVPEDAVVLLTVRNLSPRMGLTSLVDAMARVLGSRAAAGVDLRLVICGEGLLRDALQEQIRSLGIEDRVTLAGRVADARLVNWYQAADLFVLPTMDMEGFGIVTVEALSSNLPVIGTPAGATPEILGRIDTRLLTVDTSAESIADAIASWLEWRREDRGGTRYRDEAVTRYSWDRIADEVESFYAETLEAFRKGGGRGGRATGQA